jgi:hypothetical protein
VNDDDYPHSYLFIPDTVFIPYPRCNIDTLPLYLVAFVSHLLAIVPNTRVGTRRINSNATTRRIRKQYLFTYHASIALLSP